MQVSILNIVSKQGEKPAVTRIQSRAIASLQYDTVLIRMLTAREKKGSFHMKNYIQLLTGVHRSKPFEVEIQTSTISTFT